MTFLDGDFSLEITRFSQKFFDRTFGSGNTGKVLQYSDNILAAFGQSYAIFGQPFACIWARFILIWVKLLHILASLGKCFGQIRISAKLRVNTDEELPSI